MCVYLCYRRKFGYASVIVEKLVIVFILSSNYVVVLTLVSKDLVVFMLSMIDIIFAYPPFNNINMFVLEKIA